MQKQKIYFISGKLIISNLVLYTTISAVKIIRMSTQVLQ